MANCQQEYFLPGAVIQCTTCLGEVVKGEVVAFERLKKLLILKSSLSGGKSQIHLVNLDFVKDIIVVKEQLQSALQNQQMNTSHFNFTKIQRRKQEEIDRKRRSISSVKISPEGQRVFIAIRKTIDEVHWDGESIVVFNSVVVPSPYRSEDVQTRASLNGGALNERENAAQHVKKIIDKVWSLSKDVTDGVEKSSQLAAASSSSVNNNNNNNNNTVIKLNPPPPPTAVTPRDPAAHNKTATT